MYRYSFIVLALALLLPGPLAAQPVAGPTAEQLRMLAGTWVGELTYRDYRSGNSVTLPHRRSIEVAEDASWVSMRLEYRDPGRTVHGFELLSFDGGSFWSASTGSGRLWLQELRLESFEATDTGWLVRSVAEGSDDGVPAQLLQSWTLNGDRLQIDNSVQPADGSERFLRNTVSLERQR